MILLIADGVSSQPKRMGKGVLSGWGSGANDFTSALFVIGDEP